MIALTEAGVTSGQGLWHSDEMRFGLRGQVRRRWGLRGVKLVQKQQLTFRWGYLVLLVDVVACRLKWAFVERMNQTQLLPLFQAWAPEAIVWDGASSHRGRRMGQLNFPRVFLPPYSPELNPPERVFEVVRQQVEGQVYPSLLAKRQAIEQVLRRLNADKPRLRRLIDWTWIREALLELPSPSTRTL